MPSWWRWPTCWPSTSTASSSWRGRAQWTLFLGTLPLLLPIRLATFAWFHLFEGLRNESNAEFGMRNGECGIYQMRNDSNAECGIRNDTSLASFLRRMPTCWPASLLAFQPAGGGTFAHAYTRRQSPVSAECGGHPCFCFLLREW